MLVAQLRVRQAEFIADRGPAKYVQCLVDKAEPPGPVPLEQMHVQRAQRHDGRGRPRLPHDGAVPLQSLRRPRRVADGKAPNVVAVACRTLLRVLKVDVVRGADEEVLKLELERLERPDQSTANWNIPRAMRREPQAAAQTQVPRCSGQRPDPSV